ncbi:interleukin-1 receptor-associated kinase 4-like [Oscarella lobularis]|uniref:interleukin-1 receptor-associated kinase 4-like n=1 Tax=Oscarella lobularis TaxID=121494 RepID=UPI003313A983
MNFSFTDLAQSTDNFNDLPISKGGKKLGEGGFGPVFKGILRFTEVAIKRLNNTKEKTKYKTKEQFVTEIEVLAQFRHPNLICLMGYSVDGNDPCLVYEFMENGTLEDKLDPRERAKLEWSSRMSIMRDSARGISYLHTADPQKPFIHRDIKSANILLDLAMRAKVGDFGLARSLSETGRSLKTQNVMGTSGYLAPEYLRGEITPKLDVFSFGVIMLEVLTGLAPHDPRRKEKKDLITYLESKFENPKSLLRYVDRLLGERYPKAQAQEFACIAAKCVEHRSTKRCSMTDVYRGLEKLPLVGTEEERIGQKMGRIVERMKRDGEEFSKQETLGFSETPNLVIPRGGHVFTDSSGQDTSPHDFNVYVHKN